MRSQLAYHGRKQKMNGIRCPIGGQPAFSWPEMPCHERQLKEILRRFPPIDAKRKVFRPAVELQLQESDEFGDFAETGRVARILILKNKVFGT